MDFVGPLKPNQGYNAILTMTITDCLGADIWIIPTQINISTEDLAVIFSITGSVKTVSYLSSGKC